MTITIKDYEEVYREVRDIARRFEELDVESQERLWPQIEALREELSKLYQALGERVMADTQPYMNWYPRDR